MEYVLLKYRGVISLTNKNGLILNSECYYDRVKRKEIIRKWQKMYREEMLKFIITIKPETTNG